MPRQGRPEKMKQTGSFEDVVKAAEAGCAGSQYSVAYHFANVDDGQSVNAVKFAEMAFKNPVADWRIQAGTLLADVFLKGRQHVAPSTRVAVLWLEKVAALDHAPAQLKLASLYDERNGGKEAGVEPDAARFVYWLRKAADSGEPQAQHELGGCFSRGHGVPHDDETALAWRTKAASAGYVEAQHFLALAFHGGIGMAVCHKTGISWATKAALQGHAPSQRLLGESYEQGHGVKVNVAKAVPWYEKAAMQGEVEASAHLGRMYVLAEGGLPCDYERAIPYLKYAAGAGNADAQCRLGVRYQRGEGIRQDEREAVKWYKKAAKQGVPLAQNNLGIMLLQGYAGSAPDRNAGLGWLVKAAHRGYEAAQLTVSDALANGTLTLPSWAEPVESWAKPHLGPPTPETEQSVLSTDGDLRAYACLLSNCAYCGDIPAGAKLPACAKCKLVKYCCPEHQKLAWKWHKHSCGKPLPTDALICDAGPAKLCAALGEFGLGSVDITRHLLQLLSIKLFCRQGSSSEDEVDRLRKSLLAKPADGLLALTSVANKWSSSQQHGTHIMLSALMLLSFMLEGASESEEMLAQAVRHGVPLLAASALRARPKFSVMHFAIACLTALGSAAHEMDSDEDSTVDALCDLPDIATLLLRSLEHSLVDGFSTGFSVETQTAIGLDAKSVTDVDAISAVELCRNTLKLFALLATTLPRGSGTLLREAVPVIQRAMQQHASSADVVEQGCAAMSFIMRSGAKLKDLPKCLNSVVESAALHLESGGVQLEGCRFVTMLAQYNHRKLVLAKPAALALVAAAFKHHASSADVLSSACGAMNNLCSGEPSAALEALRQVPDTLTYVLKAMNKHPTDEQMAIHGCMLLNNVALTPGLEPRSVKLLLEKAPATMLAVKRGCGDSAHVSEYASIAANALQALSRGKVEPHKFHSVPPLPLSTGQNDDRTSSRVAALAESVRSILGRHLFNVESIVEL